MQNFFFQFQALYKEKQNKNQKTKPCVLFQSFNLTDEHLIYNGTDEKVSN